MGHFAKKKSCLHGPSFRNHCTWAIPFINFVQGLSILLLLNLFFFLNFSTLKLMSLVLLWWITFSNSFIFENIFVQ